MGWSIDSQQLYIGNGTISEGAPELGITEILTQHSDILAVVQSYTFKGSSAGYTVQTGPSGTQPVIRTLQQKLDDFVSVKDFGAAGDGVTNDTAAINRALFQLYCLVPSNVAARRKLYFPAGTYLISGDVVRIPTYANIFGDGKNRTIIVQSDNTQSAVVKIADSMQQIDSNVGTNGATLPQYIDVVGVTFSSQFDQPILSMIAATNLYFDKCGFNGPLSLPSTQGNANPCVSILSYASSNSKNVEFSACDFGGLGFAVTADDDMQQIVFNRCTFHDLFQGHVLGKNTNGIGAAVKGPTGWRIQNSYFNKVYDIGLNVYNITGVTSFTNYFDDVANANLGVGNPTNNIISFLGTDNQSIGDIFSRTDADNNLFSRVVLNGLSNLFELPHVGLQTGYYRVGPAGSFTLANNTVSATATGITLSITSANSYFIEYSIARGNNLRTGIMTITVGSSGQVISDEFIENSGATNTVFSLSALSGNNVTLNFTTDNQGTPATFKYVVKRFTLA